MVALVEHSRVKCVTQWTRIRLVESFWCCLVAQMSWSQLSIS
ncbi:hypothetical protein SynMEDNS5_01861 [Synechococcus sp. MEDNS5]|nr:hypothetical protein SynMEDNS5_01861 [Synechococcus sp. MEDNS5]